jgi:hypothetical protein
MPARLAGTSGALGGPRRSVMRHRVGIMGEDGSLKRAARLEMWQW